MTMDGELTETPRKRRPILLIVVVIAAIVASVLLALSLSDPLVGALG